MKYAIQQMRLGKSIKYIDTHMNSPFHHFRQFVLEGIQELLIGRSQISKTFSMAVRIPEFHFTNKKF